MNEDKMLRLKETPRNEDTGIDTDRTKVRLKETEQSNSDLIRQEDSKVKDTDSVTRLNLHSNLGNIQ